MIDGDWSRFGDEIAQLHRSQGDPALDALAVAIYVEDATGVTLPDQLLHDASLRTADGTSALLDHIAEGR
jgi:hypothetical protein